MTPMFTNMMMTAVTMISPGFPLRAHTILHFDIQLCCIKYTRTLLLVGLDSTIPLLVERLEPLDLGVGVDELLDLLDLEDPV